MTYTEMDLDDDCEACKLWYSSLASEMKLKR
jgi:hypothetical protein